MQKRSCLKCSRLQECKLKDYILNPDIPTCNYAEEGCLKYKGPGNRSGTAKEKVLEALMAINSCTINDLSAYTGLPIDCEEDKKIIFTAIYRLIKDGYKIKRLGNRYNKVYQLEINV